MLKINSLWRNKKTNRVYKVLYMAQHSETLEDMVVYVQKEKSDVSTVWVRPYELFCQKFIAE